MSRMIVSQWELAVRYAPAGGEVQSVVKALAIPRLGALQRFGE